MAYVDLNKRRQTKNKLNREDYAAMKADPVLNDYLLEKERNRRRARTRKRQDQKIEEVARRMAAFDEVHKYGVVNRDYYFRMATAALYPERLIK